MYYLDIARASNLVTKILKCFILFFREKYSEFNPCGVVANCIGVSTLVFAILVVYLVANPRYKRLTEVEVDKYRWGQEMSELEIAEENNKPST